MAVQTGRPSPASKSRMFPFTHWAARFGSGAAIWSWGQKSRTNSRLFLRLTTHRAPFKGCGYWQP